MPWIRLNSIQTRLTLILAGALLVPAIVVAALAYLAFDDAIRINTAGIVGRVAETRRTQLVQRLTFEQQHAFALIEDAWYHCRTRVPCLKDELHRFVATEGALGAALVGPGGLDIVVGDSIATAVGALNFRPGQIAQFPGRTRPQRDYFVLAEDAASGLRIAVSYPLDKIQPLFGDHPDLGKSGENFLADPEGVFITSTRYPTRQGPTDPIEAAPMQRCLAPGNGEILAPDHRGIPVIHGFRFVREIGGGCIMAHIDQMEAFAPLEKLRQKVLAFVVAFGLLAVLAARALGRTIARPIRWLANVSRAVAAGDAAARADTGGYDEIAEVGKAFNAMTDRLAGANADLERRVRERTESLRLMSSAFENNGEAVVITDAANRIVKVNPAFTALTGYTAEDVLGRDPKILSAGRTPAATYRQMWADLAAKGHWSGELWDRRKSGECYPKWASLAIVHDAHGRVTHYIANYTDISERKASEERMLHLAHHDALTQLPNRLHLTERLSQAIAVARRSNTRLALLLLDLDRFKAINDSMGHHVGDELLIEVARRLTASVRETDIVARLGGDEFVVVITALEDLDDIAQVAEKLLQNLAAPYLIGNATLRSSSSIGICVYPDNAVEINEVLRSADIAMYHAKTRGRGNYQFFAEDMNVRARERHEMESDLRVALEQGQFELHYQPQIDVRTGQICGVEALARWRHPVRGMVPPTEFIPVAEDAGLIGPLGDWILGEACRQLGRWRAAGLLHIRMSVNLSARQFAEATLPERIGAILAETGLPAGMLDLEITESLSMEAPGDAIAIMRKLTGQGMSLSIDDFGTGYSSLAYLKLFPIRTLKIDRSFVKDIETDPNDADICDVTVLLAHKLGLEVVAEGVETAAQLKFLLSIGCERVQGYLFSKPLPAAKAERFVRNVRPMTGLGTVELWQTEEVVI